MIEGIKNLDTLYFGIDWADNPDRKSIFVITASGYKNSAIKQPNYPSLRGLRHLYPVIDSGLLWAWSMANTDIINKYGVHNLPCYITPQLLKGFFDLNPRIIHPNYFHVEIDGSFGRRRQDITKSLCAQALGLAPGRITITSGKKANNNLTCFLISAADALAHHIQKPRNRRKISFKKLEGILKRKINLT